VLIQKAADYVMIDPTWVGGISETRRAAEFAQVFNVPALMHDCTGPLTLLSGLQISASCTNVTYQETVRAHIKTLYPLLIDEPIKVEKGYIALPARAGLGARLLPELFSPDLPNYRITRL
jgi:L-alanine-DL-glutamate epimerase-like enolase superfamily enzyme